MAAPRKSARENISAEINSGVTRARVKTLLDTAFDATVPVDAECPSCGEQLRAKAPDLKKQLDVLVALLEQAEGRPGQQAPGELQVVIERPPR